MRNPQHILKVAGVTFMAGYPKNLQDVHAYMQENSPSENCQQCWPASDPSRHGDDKDLREFCRTCRGTGIVGGHVRQFAGFMPGEREPEPVVLIRNPDNEVDRNAVQVHLPKLWPEGMVGHLDKHEAAHMAPLLDAGVQFRAGVSSVNVMPGHENRPGIEIVVQQVGSQPTRYTVEQPSEWDLREANRRKTSDERGPGRDLGNYDESYWDSRSA